MRLITLFLLVLVIAAAQTVPHSTTLTASCSGTCASGDPITAFNFYKSLTSGGPYAKIGSVAGISSATFVDTSVVAGQTAYYVATVVNGGGGESTYSTQVACVTPFQTPPAPPGLSGQVK